MHFVLGFGQIYVGAVLLIIGAHMAKNFRQLSSSSKAIFASLDPRLRVAVIIAGVLQIVLSAVDMHPALLALFHAA